jgi:hypothetical protein|tara:strand:- start:205 stop:525 length:321 start_codon:yes stop_codon:yes gene_type:complete
MNHPNLTDNSYAIIVTPTEDDEGVWTGEVSVSISLSQDNTLDDSDKRELETLCEYMTSVLPAIEDDEEVRELLSSYVGEAISRLPESSLENNQQVFNFASLTKGNA